MYSARHQRQGHARKRSDQRRRFRQTTCTVHSCNLFRPSQVYDQPPCLSKEPRNQADKKQMKMGEYDLFTDGSHTERRPYPAGVTGTDSYRRPCSISVYHCHSQIQGIRSGSGRGWEGGGEQPALRYALAHVEVVAMPPPGGCARGGGQWAGTHGPPRSVPARRVEEDNGTQ